MAGLSTETVLNLEAAPGLPNASGFRPTLWLFASPEFKVEPNEFECHAPVGWNYSAGFPPRGNPLVENRVLSERIPGNAQMLSERDFMKALTEGLPKPAYSLKAAAMSRIATLANADEAIGVSAQYRVGNQFSGNLFVVVKTRNWWPRDAFKHRSTSSPLSNFQATRLGSGQRLKSFYAASRFPTFHCSEACVTRCPFRRLFRAAIGCRAVDYQWPRRKSASSRRSIYFTRRVLASFRADNHPTGGPTAAVRFRSLA